MNEEAWTLLRKIVNQNKESMKEMEMKEAIKDAKSTKKMNTYNGARQAFISVSDSMNMIEEFYKKDVKG